MILKEEAINLLRAKQQLSRKELARKSNISTTTLRIGYRTHIDAVVIGKIATALGVEPEDIIQEGD